MHNGEGLTIDEWHSGAGQPGAPGLRRELLDGEPVVMAAASPAHANCVNRLTRLLLTAVGDRASVAAQTPLVLDERSEPVPDLAVTSPGGDLGGGGSKDVLLLIEVSDSSIDLTYDRGRKASYYARSGIPECWIVDLTAHQIIVHRDPASVGYRDIRNLREGAVASIGGLDGLEVPVSELLGPD